MSTFLVLLVNVFKKITLKYGEYANFSKKANTQTFRLKASEKYLKINRNV